MRAVVAILPIALIAAAPTPPACARDLGETLRNGLYGDATLTVHARSYYLDRTNPAPPSHVAWAGGGWVGYETGWFHDLLRFGVVGYTSQPLVAPPGTGGTLLLGPGQSGYTVLGQAWGKLKVGEQELTAWRQLINQPEVNPQDNRMTPNTFEAYLLSGKLWRIGYLAGYVDKIKPRDSAEFIDMARHAGAPAGVRQGMALAGLSYAPNDDFKVRLSSYLVPDVLASGYGDVSGWVSLPHNLDLRIGAQIMVQGSNGANLLTGRPFSTWSGGIDVDLIMGNATLTASYTQTGSAAAWRSPYGTWAGYTNMIVRDFNRANEGALLVGATVDFAFLGVSGLAFTTNAAFGNGAINPATGAPLARTNEYDFTLDFLFANSTVDWPGWMKPLWLRGRAALVDQFERGGMTTLRDYRIILNYEWKFGGKGR